MFSFGVLLLEMITGEFPERSMADVRNGIMPPLKKELKDKYSVLAEIMEASCKKSKTKIFNTENDSNDN